MDISKAILVTSDKNEELLKLNNYAFEEKDNLGKRTPIVRIKDQYVPSTSIKQFEIDSTGFIPNLNLTIDDTTGHFKGVFTPKKEEILTIMIRSESDDFEPIKANFIITSIFTSIGTVFINAKLWIPKIDEEVNLSYPNMTSVEVLNQIATELGLGFATNEDITEDIMTWIIPYKSRSTFIQEIGKKMYKDENLNFWEIFIDIYYNLNVINVSTLLVDADQEEFLDTVDGVENISVWLSEYFEKDRENTNTDPEEEENMSKLFLTNLKSFEGSSKYFKEFEVIVNNTSFYNQMGDSRNYLIYDQNDKVLYTFPFEINLEKDVEGKGLTLEGDSKVKWIWGGISSDNVHLNWEWSQYVSEIGKAFWERNFLSLKLDLANFILFRYIKIPIFIFTLNEDERDFLEKLEEFEGGNGDKKEEQSKLQNTTVYPNPILNKFNSGYYLIKDITWKWNSEFNHFVQEFNLIKPLWNNPIQSLEEAEKIVS